MRHWQRVLILAAVLARPALAQEAVVPNLAVVGTGAPGGVAQLALAQQLYVLAAARHDPQSALAAARLARGVTAHDLKVSKETSAIKEAVATSTSAGVDGPVPADAMLALARELAGNDETMLTLVDIAEAETPTDSLTAARTVSRLDAGEAEVWKLAFFGGALAEIGVLGGGDAPLRLRVADENDATICQQSGPGASLYCNWFPARNGYFTVTVFNPGSAQNRYDLLTN